MRIMYDGIDTRRIPSNPPMVAGYVNGKWPSALGYKDAQGKAVPSIYELFPNAVHVKISVFNDTVAHVLDVEQYDATPAQAPAWAQMCRKNGVAYPTVYCSQSIWQQVRNAFHATGVMEPLYWIANYDGIAEIPSGAIAKQYHNTPGYDLSVVADRWPGVDITAKQPVPPKSYVTYYTVHSGDTLSSIGGKYHVSWEAIYNANRKVIGNNPNFITPGMVLLIPQAGPAPTPKVNYYKVQPGDTLTHIAAKFHLRDWEQLYNANRRVIGSNPNYLRIGEVLVIP